MAIDAFIKFYAADDKNAVKGESQDKTFNGKSDNWSAVRSVTFATEHKASIGTSSLGAGGGKVGFQDFVIKKYVDIASPQLFLALCAGAHFTKVELHLRKAVGGDSATGKTGAYLLYTFHLVFVTKIGTTLDAEAEAPEEEVTFAYGATSISYQQQDVTGKMLGSPLAKEWSCITNDASTNIGAH